MNEQQKEQLEALKENLPYIRGLLAFVLKTRFGWFTDECYKEADYFLEILKEDIENQ